MPLICRPITSKSSSIDAPGNPREGESSLRLDDEVPPAVVAGLAASGIDVRRYVPRRLADEQLDAASHVVSFGCELPVPARSAPSVAQWIDIPLVSKDFERARDAIVRRVTELVDELGGVMVQPAHIS